MTGGIGPTAAPPGAAEASGPQREAVDPELLSLPAPPRGKRLATLVLMALVVATCLAFLAHLQGDLRYFLSAPEATNLGQAAQLDPAALVSNTYVRVRGTPMASLTVRYSRWGDDTPLALFPLAGQRHLWVRVRAGRAEEERTSARREFAGRLVTLGQLGPAFGAVRDYLARDMHAPVSSETFVLLADKPPASYGGAVVLAVLCGLFILVDVGLMVWWFRPLKSPR